MNLQDFGNALKDTYTAMNMESRRRAEDYIKHLSTQQGFGPMVMDFVMQPHQSTFYSRQAAAVQLKNFIRPKRKNPMSKGQWQRQVHPQDKTYIKQKILQAINVSEYQIKSVLGHIFYDIIDAEFPGEWNPIPEVLSYFQAGNNDKLLTGLIALEKLTKLYAGATQEVHRRPLEQMVKEFFPILIPLNEALLEEKNLQNMDCAVLRMKIMIIYNNVLGTAYVPQAMDTSNDNYSMARVVMEQLNRVMIIPVTRDPSQGGYSSPLFDEKKYAGYTIYSLASRFVGLLGKEENKTKPFADWWLKNFGIPFLNTHLELIKRHQSEPLPEFIINRSLYYIERVINHPEIYHHFIKPKIRFFFNDVLFPFVCYSSEDDELYQNAPKEYLSFEFSVPEGDDFSCRVAALQCYKSLLIVQNATEQFWEFILFITDEFKNLRAPERKFGAYYLLGNTKSCSWGFLPYRQDMEKYMMQHIVPDLTNAIPFLQAHAFWVIGQHFDGLTRYQDHAMVTGIVCDHIMDNNIITRCSAGIALAQLMQQHNMAEMLQPKLNTILSQFIEFMKTIDSPLIITALGEIIETNGPQVVPFALNILKTITTQLTESLKDTDEGDSLEKCINYLHTLLNLLRALRDSKHLFEPIEFHVIPLIKQLLLEDEDLNFKEDGFELLTFLTFNAPTITPELWQCYPIIFDSYYKHELRWFFDHMIAPLDNYISYGTEEFLSSPRYLNLLMTLLRTFLEDDQIDQRDLRSPIMLLSTLLQACKGRLPRATFLEILNNVVVLYEIADLPKLSRLLMNALGDCFAYDSQLVFEHLISKNLLDGVISKWLDEIPNLKSDYERKVAVLGITSILNNDLMKLPMFIQNNTCRLLVNCVVMLMTNHQNKLEAEHKQFVLEKSKQELLTMFSQNRKDASIKDAVQSLLEAESRGDINETMVSLRDSPYFQEVIKNVHEPEGNESDDDIALFDDATITTAIDSVNEFFVFAEMCFRLSTQYPQIFHQQIMANLDQKISHDLHDILNSYVQQNQHLVPALTAVFRNKGSVKLT
mmetsp:Transcript_4500/g.6618  ORF Transcript_4500/g.6618 Transcript_4500/m.6618 type:complete len:1039 (+) Transcript_4500:136-3252(+)